MICKRMSASTITPMRRFDINFFKSFFPTGNITYYRTIFVCNSHVTAYL